MRNTRTRRIRPLVVAALAGSLLAGGGAVAVSGGLVSASASGKPADTIANAAAAQSNKASKCQGSAVGVVGKWTEGLSSCAFFGSKSTPTFTYELWGDKYAELQRSQVEVFGIAPNGKGTWYKAGVIAGGTEQETVFIKVPWGNSAATPKIRVKPIPIAGAVVTKVSFAHR
ncbi:hypothetical protein [Streptomyces lancefieldiae]|uniref:Secreted protein n=1 Tax=Streptomyces lancefieldiae TaxID=3075520 RepID=A0ABU3AR45_9ACTN|nr:hypothetical protein [Streptomyces sp. DSM 40712]MDT0612682.1 hypothetical protein [Streptomyces sp. DSM 40712]